MHRLEHNIEVILKYMNFIEHNILNNNVSDLMKGNFEYTYDT